MVILSRGRDKRPSRTLPEIHDNPTFRYVREVSVFFFVARKLRNEKRL